MISGPISDLPEIGYTEAVRIALEDTTAQNHFLCEASGSGYVVVLSETRAGLYESDLVTLCNDPEFVSVWVRPDTRSVKTALTLSGTLRKS